MTKNWLKLLEFSRKYHFCLLKREKKLVFRQAIKYQVRMDIDWKTIFLKIKLFE